MRWEPKRGDWVVYRKTKCGLRPGPRAKDVAPAAQGDLYSYVVAKYWVVLDVTPDGRVRLRTRTGKEHLVAAEDPNLRPAHWWERWLRRDRFRAAERDRDEQPPAESSVQRSGSDAPAMPGPIDR